MTSGAIAARFECSWPTTTRHLRVLEDAGLVRVELQGRERVYKLETHRLTAVAGTWIQRFGRESSTGSRGESRGVQSRLPPERRAVSSPRRSKVQSVSGSVDN